MQRPIHSMKHGNRYGEKKKKSVIIIMNWQWHYTSQWMSAPSWSVFAYSMTVWDSVTSSLNKNHWIISLLKKNIPSLPCQATIPLFGYRAIMIRRNMIILSPAYRKSEGWWNRQSLPIRLKLLSHRQVCRLLLWWKRMMVFTSTFTRQPSSIILVCTSTWTIKTWYSNLGWLRMQKGTKDICRHLAIRHGVLSLSVMMHATSLHPVLLSTWTNHASYRTQPLG